LAKVTDPAKIAVPAVPEEPAGGARARNRRRLVEELRQRGGVSLPDLEDQTGLSRSTVSGVVAELRRHRLVVDENTPPTPNKIGRRPSMVALNPSLGVAIGVVIQPGTVRVGIGNIGLDILANRLERPPFAVGKQPEAALKLISRIIAEELEKESLGGSRVLSIVLSVPAPVEFRRRPDGEYDRGMVGHSGDMEPWKGTKPAEELEGLLKKTLGIPVLIENDANLSAWAEVVTGSPEIVGSQHVLYILATGQGVGMGLVIDGRPYLGATGYAGEIAHMVIQPGGPMCWCGRRGCLTAITSGRRVVDDVRQGLSGGGPQHEVDARDLDTPGLGVDSQLDVIIDWARRGEPTAVRVVQEVGNHIGLAVGNVVNLLNPECVVVGGRMARAGDIFLNPLITAVHEHTSMLPKPPTPVFLGRWKENVEMLGAIAFGVRARRDAPAERLATLVERSLGPGRPRTKTK
jgi:predicted NBD/HSP70 family sugar kinase